MTRWLIAAALLACPVRARAAEPKPTAVKSTPAFPDPSAWSLEQNLAANLQARIHKARQCAAVGDVLGWGRAVMPHSFPLNFCELHRYQVATRHDPWTAIEAPRGHSKTTVGAILIPLYQALNEPHTYRHYLNIQSNGTKADAVNITIKMEIEENPVIRAIYGNQRGLAVWNNSQFVLANGVCFSARGAGTSLRGIQYRTVRPDWINLDDLYDEDDIHQPDGTTKKTEWFWSTLFPARSKSRAAKFNAQGTAINEQDILYKLEQDPNFKFKRFTAVLADGSPLWPELNSAASLAMEKASMGDAIFNREYQMERGSDAESIIKKSWLTGWRRSPADFRCDARTDPYRLRAVLVGIDPSVGKKQVAAKAKVGDPSAYARVWKLQPMDTPGALPVYFIDALVIKVLGMQERIDAAKEMVSTARPDRKVRQAIIETIAGFDDIGTLIAAAIGVPCEKVDSVDDKMLNLEKHQVYWQNGRVFINENIDKKTLETIEYQLTTNRPDHDDGRDAVFLCVDDGKKTMDSWVNG